MPEPTGIIIRNTKMSEQITYTQMVKNKLKAAVNECAPDATIASADFVAGYNYAKGEIIKAVDKVN